MGFVKETAYTPGKPSGEQVGPADLAGEVGRAVGQDAGGGGDQVGGGLQQDGEADPVGVQAGAGGGGVGGGADECLVDGQQRPGLLVDSGQAAGAQDPSRLAPAFVFLSGVDASFATGQRFNAFHLSEAMRSATA